MKKIINFFFPLGNQKIYTLISEEQCLDSLKSLQINNKLRGEIKSNCFTLFPICWRFENMDSIVRGRIYSNKNETYLDLNFTVCKRSACAIIVIISLLFIMYLLAFSSEVITYKNFNFLIGLPIFFFPIWGIIYLRLYIEKQKLLNLIEQCVKSNKK
ncbi:hypothetical protein KAH27_08170 [bacterium]|nr:hypothetical protein [bacterium]